MSRSNHNYYNICQRDLLEEDGRCWWHAWRGQLCYGEREYETRRGFHRRRSRFPKWSVKSFHHGPPMCIKKLWHRQARAQQNEEMRSDDPVITPMKRLIDLWDWY